MRLFFAIWPDETARNRLSELAKRLHGACGGKVTRSDSIHLTLVFLGEVEKTESLLEAASVISANAFEIRVDRATYWKHNRIAWAGTSAIPEELAKLVDALKRALEQRGFSFDERNYVPHVTLVRKAGMAENLPEFEPFSWRVSEFCLAASSESGYRILEKWPLTGC